MSKLFENRKKIEDLKKENVQLVKELLLERSKEIFETYPDIKGFCWNQYTPYFNDGEPCVFGWTGDFYLFNDDGDDEYCNQTLIINFLANVEDDELYELFGDHAQIIVKRDGIVVETYDEHY